MATPNYGYEKRQRELAKKKKKEEKLRAKAQGRPHDSQDGPPSGDAAFPADAPAPSQPAAAAGQ
ncbi:MAG: hypothetical protein PHI55_06055 [Burkholderiaceae bacterium]|nr:hypothetical protein [Burkholderiaceae bacterium]